MSDKRFEAILAKNRIARELSSNEPNLPVILVDLSVLEHYIGVGNQPSISDIYQNNSDPFKRRNI